MLSEFGGELLQLLRGRLCGRRITALDDGHRLELQRHGVKIARGGDDGDAGNGIPLARFDQEPSEVAVRHLVGEGVNCSAPHVPGLQSLRVRRF